MRRTAWLNALLAVAVAALGAWAYLKPSNERAAEYPLSALKPAEARSIRIERGAGAPVVLERKDDAWFLVSPFAARAEPARVRALLDILEATTPHRFAATDLQRFELASPRARLTVNEQSFGFGMVSPVTREQYVLTAEAVFAVHPRYGTALPPRGSELASRGLFAPGETPVRIGLGTFAVEQRDGQWTSSPPGSAASPDDLARWMEEWRLATALRVEPADKTKALETIRVRLKSGGTLSLHVLAREPQLVILREDENLQFAFPPETAARLLSPPVTRKVTRDQ